MPIILLILGIFIIVLSLRGIKKENKSFSKLLYEKEDNLGELKIEIADIRRCFGETIADLQIEIRDLREEVETLKKCNNNANKDKDVISDIDFDEFNKKIKVGDKKCDKIRELIKKGLTDEEICVNLSIGKGEVLLVRNFLKK